MDELIETAIRYKWDESRTAPGERGIDLYARVLFPDALAAKNNPLHT